MMPKFLLYISFHARPTAVMDVTIGRKYAVCRDRSSGNGYGEAGFESGTGSRKRADRIEGAGN